MKKNSIFYIFFVFFFFLIINFSFSQENIKSKTSDLQKNSYSQEEQNLHGFDLCQNFSDFLKPFNINFDIQPLIFSEQNEFPFNIKFSLPADPIQYSKIYSEKNLTNLTLIFKIEEATRYKTFFTHLLNKIKDEKRDFDLDIVFTYGDTQKKIISNQLKGTDVFIQSLQNQNEMAAVCINFSGNKTEIIPGGGKDSSPSWLIKRLSKSFYKNKIDFTLQSSNLTTLYRFDLLREDENTAKFLKEHIPSCAITIPVTSATEEKFALLISDFIKSYTQKNTSKWDRHFYTLTLGKRIFYFDEFFITTLFIITIILNLLFVCTMPGILKNKQKNKKKSFAQKIFTSWLLAIFTILITVLSLSLSQTVILILSKIIPFSPYIQMTLKILLSLAVFSLELFIIKKKNAISSEEFYTYLTTISCIFNLILFTLIDISLFFLFLIQYIIVLISKNIKKIIPLSVLFIFLLFPYIPYFVQFLKYASANSFEKLIDSSLAVNISVSFAILPVQLFTMRLISKLKSLLLSTDEKNRRFQKQNIIAIMSSFALFLLIFIIILNFLPDTFSSQTKETENKTFITQKDDLILLDYIKYSYLEETTVFLDITLLKNAEQCQISVSNEDKNPVVYSDEPYISNKETHTDYFLTPAFPPKKLNFKYISKNEEKSILTVKCVFPTKDENTYIFQEKQIEIKDDSSNSFNFPD